MNSIEWDVQQQSINHLRGVAYVITDLPLVYPFKTLTLQDHTPRPTHLSKCEGHFANVHYQNRSAVIWLKYCRNGLKPYSINSLKQTSEYSLPLTSTLNIGEFQCQPNGIGQTHGLNIKWTTMSTHTTKRFMFVIFS